MNSLIKSINTNCCYGGTTMVKNRSEKEIAFDITSKNLCIVDITHIRKNYQRQYIREKDQQVKQLHNSGRTNVNEYENEKIQDQKYSIVKLSQQKRKSLLSVYCQKVSRMNQQQISLNFNQKPMQLQHYSQFESTKQFQSIKHFQSVKTQVKKQKIKVTCAKNDPNHCLQIRKKHSEGSMKIDNGHKTIESYDKFYKQSLQAQKNKRFSMQIEPNIIQVTKQLNRNSQTMNRSFTPCNIPITRLSSNPSKSMKKYNLNKSTEYEKVSMCTTVQNSQNHSLANNLAEDNARNQGSKIQECHQRCQESVRINENGRMKRIEGTNLCERDKENDMNVANNNKRVRKYFQLKANKVNNKHEAKTSDRQKKVTQSILFTQTKSPHTKFLSPFNPHSINQQQQTTLHLHKINNQLNHLHQEYTKLKHQQFFLVNKLNHDHNQFEIRYKLLLEKKLQCQMQEKRRRQEIQQIRRLLWERVKELGTGQWVG